jgi:uncharacterized protein (TIGR00255 family)
MIQSMTGYAVASAESPRGRISLELRSVNARFLDLQFRVADELRALEPQLRELIAARVSRGKVDCRFFYNESDSLPRENALNEDAIQKLKKLAAQAKSAFPDAAPLRVADVLRWPGVLAQPQADEEAMRALGADLCRRALDELVAARAREGRKLAAAVGERIAAMRRRVADVVPLLPESIRNYQKRISDRLKEALGTADEERIRAEVAVFATRIDVDEELDRLRAHLDEVERVLAKGGAAGKRLDFLAQELNREANTLASKAASKEVSDCALELKLFVEQVREQVQNIE